MEEGFMVSGPVRGERGRARSAGACAEGSSSRADLVRNEVLGMGAMIPRSVKNAELTRIFGAMAMAYGGDESASSVWLWTR